MGSPTSTWPTTTARPYGAAERNFGTLFAQDWRPYRDELVISSKAGYDMWPGPYGDHGSRKYLLASLDQSLARMGLDYVDIFYSHRFDPDTPLEETMGALDTAVRSGRALYAGISSYSPERTREAAAILRSMGTPLLIHQPSYSMLNRWVEEGLLDVLGEEGIGCIAFSPLAQGMLTDRYLAGIPAGSRAAQGKSLDPGLLSEAAMAHVRALNDLAAERGQSLAQLALSWALRDERVTSVLIGASSTAQLDANLACLDGPPLTDDELTRIDQHAVEAGHQPVAPLERPMTATAGIPGAAGTPRAVADGYLDALTALDPILATQLGSPLGADRLPDFSPDGIAAEADLARRALVALAAAQVASRRPSRRRPTTPSDAVRPAAAGASRSRPGPRGCR